VEGIPLFRPSEG